VRKTITRFYDALEHGDGKTACALLTAANRREVRTMNVERGAHLKPCDRNIIRQLGGPPQVDVTKVRVRRDAATASVSAPGAGRGNAQLVRRHGSWLVDAY
jgi:hypothetical protein